MRAICEGTADIPEDTRRAYIDRWVASGKISAGPGYEPFDAGDCEPCNRKAAAQTPPRFCIWEAHPGAWHRLVTSSPNGCACREPRMIAPHAGYLTKTECAASAAAQVTDYGSDDEDD